MTFLSDVFKTPQHLRECILDPQFNFKLNGSKLNDKDIKFLEEIFDENEGIKVKEIKHKSYSTISINYKGLGILTLDIPDLDDWLQDTYSYRVNSIVHSNESVIMSFSKFINEAKSSETLTLNKFLKILKKQGYHVVKKEVTTTNNLMVWHTSETAMNAWNATFSVFDSNNLLISLGSGLEMSDFK